MVVFLMYNEINVQCSMPSVRGSEAFDDFYKKSLYKRVFVQAFSIKKRATFLK
jgi:hypothetical protein